MKHVTVGIPTKDRYSRLSLLLWTLLDQSFKDWDLLIIDDSEDRKDIREIPVFQHILRRLDKEGHQWKVFFGRKKGPHWSHDQIVNSVETEFLMRIDDDCCFHIDCLKYLIEAWNELLLQGHKIGGIGPIVLDPSIPSELEFLPVGFLSFKKFQGKVDSTGWNDGSQQWRRHPDDKIQNVEHIHSSFLYRVEDAKNIGGYDLEYDLPGHREETDFTLRLHRNGFKNFVAPKALIWHLRDPQGGIRTFNQTELWENCQKHFVKKFNFKAGNTEKIFKIGGGLGDHICATPLIRSLKKLSDKVSILAIYPYIFQGNENIDELIFLGDEKNYEKIETAEVYRFGFDNSFGGKVSEAWCKAANVSYDNDKLDYKIYPQESKEVKDIVGNDKFVLISTAGSTAVVQYGDSNLTTSAGKRTAVKDWMPDRWIELVRTINKMGLKVYQVGGAKDDKVEGCSKYFLGTDYRLSLALVERCQTWISIDTFLQHGGTAVGKPGVVLFGSTNPKIFGHDLNVNIYKPEVCNTVDCLHGNTDQWQWQFHTERCPLEGSESMKCLKSITVDEVLGEVLRLKKRNG